MCEAVQINWKLPTEKAEKGRQHRSKKAKMAAGSASAKVAKVPKKRGPKPRPKSAPMSKYRRKTANMRERMRMGEINKAFESLQERIPALATAASKGKCEKMTKVNVLHVAINYIRALENILDSGDAGVNVYGTAVVQSPQVKVANKDDVNAEVKQKAKRTSKKKKGNVAASTVTPVLDDNKNILPPEEEQDLKDQDTFPDWTELTSTLDFPMLSNVVDEHFGDPPCKLNLSPVLTTKDPFKKARTCMEKSFSANTDDFFSELTSSYSPSSSTSSSSSPTSTAGSASCGDLFMEDQHCDISSFLPAVNPMQLIL